MKFKYLNNSYTKIIFIILLFAIIIYNSYTNVITAEAEKLIDNKKDKKEAFSDFIPNSSSLSAIFKHPELDLKAYPNVEIKPGQLFLQDNKFLPECCFYYSNYSTDKGCPCITPEQQDYLLKRGLNKNSGSFVQEGKDYTNKFYSDTLALKGQNPVPNFGVYPTNREILQPPEAENNFYKIINMQGRDYGFVPERTYIESKDECPATMIRNSLGVCVTGPHCSSDKLNTLGGCIKEASK